MKHKLLVLLLSFATFGCESDYTLIRVEPYEPPVEEEIPTVVEDPPITIDIIPLEPDIIVTPTYYDFGDLVSGCPEYTEILIENIGTAPLTVDSLLFSTSGDITLDYNGNGAFPWTILPQGSRTVLVDFFPSNEQPDFSVLKVYSDDPDEPVYTVEQAGSEHRDDTILDSWVQEEVSKADILFVVDNSGSMGQEHAHLASHTEDFINELDSLAADYQIAVITTDNSTFEGPIITPANPDRVVDLSDQMSNIGTTGSAYERPFMYAEEATTTGSATSTTGFIRPDSILSIIVVTDEDDHSSGTATDYQSHFESLKLSPDDIFVHAVAGQVPTGCTSMNGSATAATKIDQVVNATGGMFLSICAPDWGVSLSTLASAATTSRTRFTLSEIPIEITIKVYVDGALSMTGWTYDGATNQVVFDISSVPAAGADIEVEYGTYGEC